MQTRILKYFLMLILFISPMICLSQNNTVDTSKVIIDPVENMPEYKNGDEGLLNFIDRNLKYPEAAKTDSVQGTVYASFRVDTNGKTFHHRIIRGVRADLDSEAIRVARLIKFEKPAMQRGKPVVIGYCLPIRFSLVTSKRSCERKKGD